MSQGQLGVCAVLELPGKPVLMRVVAGVLAWTFLADACHSQIMFNSINPGQIVTTRIEPPKMRRMSKERRGPQISSKPSLQMPRFYQSKILPNHEHIAPINMANINEFHRIKPNRIERTPIITDTIVQQPIAPERMARGIRGIHKIQTGTRPVRTADNFDQTMMGTSRPTVRFDSSIFLFPSNPPTPRQSAPVYTPNPTKSSGRASLGW